MNSNFEEKDPIASPRIDELDNENDQTNKRLEAAERRVGLLEKRVEILERGT